MQPLVHVVGARPNFIKAAPVLAALTALEVTQRLVHTGQHYDDALSDVFFRDLRLPTADISLGVGSGSHAAQTAAIMVGLEEVISAQRSPLVVVYGDVNSTIAAALVCAKLGIPIAHVEAGLRSFDRSMPEEVNRVVTDVLADLLFVTSPEGMDNLVREGVDASRMHFVGNPMIDTLLAHRHRFDPLPVRHRLGVPDRYAVATLHRPANVDDDASARGLVKALDAVSQRLPVVLPLHPRGRGTLEAVGLLDLGRVTVIDPLGYLDFLSLVRGSAVVITDSGGIQEETTILGIPCLTLRPNTERPVTITHGTNRLVTPDGLAAALDGALAGERRAPAEGPPLWDGHAGERIAAVISAWLRDQ
ncbi:UDP-N-acetylglucosamine 2-epimerase (non-hydrolyzing) [soil metagenome]